MGKNEEKVNVFHKLDEIVDTHFKIENIGTKKPHYKNKESYDKLSEQKPDYSMQVMLKKMLEYLEENYKNKPFSNSEELWRFEKQLDIKKQNKSIEKILEKAIVEFMDDDWCNQVPVASGIFNSENDRKRAIDLVHRVGEKEYEFIELKWGSDNPLKAAIEILIYGLMYIFARRNGIAPDKELTNAEKIHLQVLAPEEYYEGFGLDWLVNDFNDAFKKLLDKDGFIMDFQFKHLPKDYNSEVILDRSKLKKAIESISIRECKKSE